MKWEDCLTRIIPSAHGCPDPLAIDHVIDAARTFANRTLVWQFEATPIPTVADVADYTLQLNSDQELVRILLCEVDGRNYKIPGRVAGGQMQRRGNGGSVCTPTGPQDFRLSPAPNQSGLSIITELAVRPTLSSLGWPQDLNEHQSDIIAGALSTLLAMPRVEWRDPAEAMVQAAKFNDRIAVIAMKVSKNYGHSRQGARINWF